MRQHRLLVTGRGEDGAKMIEPHLLSLAEWIDCIWSCPGGSRGCAVQLALCCEQGCHERLSTSSLGVSNGPEGTKMSDSVYRVTEVIGVSSDSWEAAAANAVETAAKSIRDLRVAEATRFDVTIKNGKIADYRVRLNISFKYESGD
jgi:flavin-binding protein dodecin